MNKETVSINGKEYILDLDKAMKWVSNCPSNETSIETEIHIIEPLDDEDSLPPVVSVDEDGNEYASLTMPSTKEVTEVKSTKNPQMSDFRWQLIYRLIDQLFTDGYDKEDGGSLHPLQSDNELTFAHRLAMNTLINMGILKVSEQK